MRFATKRTTTRNSRTRSSSTSKRLTKTDMQRGAGLEALRIAGRAAGDLEDVRLESEVDAQRPERRLIPDAKSDRVTHLRDAELAHALKDVATVEKADDAQSATDVNAQLAVEDDGR